MPLVAFAKVCDGASPFFAKAPIAPAATEPPAICNILRRFISGSFRVCLDGGQYAEAVVKMRDPLAAVTVLERARGSDQQCVFVSVAPDRDAPPARIVDGDHRGDDQ